MISPVNSPGNWGTTPGLQSTRVASAWALPGSAGWSPQRTTWAGQTQNNQNYVNTAGIRNLTDMMTQASALQDSLRTLAQSSTFNRQVITPSNPNALTVAAGSRLTGGNMQIGINQLATGQANEGAALAANDASAFAGQVQGFELEVNGATRLITFTPAAGADNRAVQQQMAQAINNANMGVTATVVFDAEAGTSTLNIAANATGNVAAASFDIRDAGGGNIVGQMGVADATQQAQQAIFTVNGVERTSNTNTVEINRDLTVTLREETTAPVTLTAQTDTDFVVNQVREFVRNFNDLMGTAQNSASVNPRLQEDLEGVLRSLGGSMSNLGIDVGRDGRLRINEARLQQAASNQMTFGGQTVETETSRLEQFFTQPFNQAINRLGNIADRAAHSPQVYAARPPVTPGTPGAGLDPWGLSQEEIMNMFAGRGNMLVNFYRQIGMGHLLDLFI